jgi:hypothetical protein
MIFIITISSAVISLLAFYFFNIYEFSYSVDSIINKNKKTEILFSYFPLNALGYKIPYRKIKTNLKIIYGPEQLEVFRLNKKDYKIVLKERESEKCIKILVKPAGFVSSTLIEVPLS